MDERKHKLLSYIIERHIEAAEPIGSREVADAGVFDVSPATIRNEMNELESEGYLSQPHTSAGRVPTTKGYRFYVNQLIEKPDLTGREQTFLKQRVRTLEKQMDQLIRVTAKTLAEASNDAAIGASEGDAYAAGISNLLKKPEFHEAGSASEIAELFDDPFSYMERLPRPKKDSQIQVYVGDETETGRKLHCSFIVSEFHARDGEKQYIALLGPTRMNYKNNIRLMRYITELLSGGFLAALIVVKWH